MSKRGAKAVALAVAAACAVAGCAVPDGSSGAPAGTSGDPCNIAAGAIIGGLLGAAVDRNRRARGAAIGAGVGALACVAVNATTRQTRTAQQVEAEYRASRGALPPQPTITNYVVRLNPDRVRGGSEFQLISSIDVVNGSRGAVSDLRERVVLLKPDNSGELAAHEKAASQSGGGYETTFTFTLPKGVPQGAYPLQSTVYLNGTAVTQESTRLQVVRIDGATRVAVVAN